VVILLDVMFEALSRQRAIAELDDKVVPDVRLPQGQVGLHEVRGEGVGVVRRGPGVSSDWKKGDVSRGGNRTYGGMLRCMLT
jgi:hypothetical protein